MVYLQLRYGDSGTEPAYAAVPSVYSNGKDIMVLACIWVTSGGAGNFPVQLRKFSLSNCKLIWIDRHQYLLFNLRSDQGNDGIM